MRVAASRARTPDARLRDALALREIVHPPAIARYQARYRERTLVGLTMAGIPFMLTGPCAAAARGAGRATMDISSTGPAIDRRHVMRWVSAPSRGAQWQTIEPADMS